MAYNMEMGLMCGIDIPIQECQIIIHQPTLKEIALIGEDDFFTGIQTLCVNKNMLTQGETLLENTNNFQIFMTVVKEQETVDKRKAVEQLFPLIFPNKQLIIAPRSIILKENDIINTIDENNFDYFQKVIGKVFCVNSGPMDMQTFNPGDKKAQEIANKLMKARQRVAAQKSDENGGSLFARYISIISVGISSMSFSDCCNLTMYQLFDLIERYSLYSSWDLDVKARLAGSTSDKKPENWMKNIH